MVWKICGGLLNQNSASIRLEMIPDDALKNGKPYQGYDFEFWKPENVGEWRSVPAEYVDGVQGFSVSSIGGWIQKPNGIYTQGSVAKNGRKSINITSGKRQRVYLVYRLTALTFLGQHDDPRKIIINHKDGTMNGDLSNLEWCTQQENTQHAHDTGLYQNKKQVEMTNITGRHEKRVFGSMIKAVEWLRIIGHTKAALPNISKCCSGVRPHAYGYTWKFLEN